MAPSHTKRKKPRVKERPLLEHPQIDAVLNEAVQFIKNWTHKELSRLADNGEIIILPGRRKHEYTIGKYHMYKHNNQCWTVCYDEQWIQDFYDRRAALFYCIGNQSGYAKKAEEIRLLDFAAGKLAGDWAVYNSTLLKARKTRNWHQYDTTLARISQISSKLDDVQEQLEKSLAWAKYKKYQDGSHETTRTRN